MKNYPKAWVEAAEKSVYIVKIDDFNPSIGRSIRITSPGLYILTVSLDELSRVGALKDPPKPKTMLFCKTHTGYIFVAPDDSNTYFSCNIKIRFSDKKCDFEKYQQAEE